MKVPFLQRVRWKRREEMLQGTAGEILSGHKRKMFPNENSQFWNNWNNLSREAVNSLILHNFKMQLDRVLGHLFKTTLLPKRLHQMILEDSSNLKVFHDSMTVNVTSNEPACFTGSCTKLSQQSDFFSASKTYKYHHLLFS